MSIFRRIFENGNFGNWQFFRAFPRNFQYRESTVRAIRIFKAFQNLFFKIFSWISSIWLSIEGNKSNWARSLARAQLTRAQLTRAQLAVLNWPCSIDGAQLAVLNWRRSIGPCSIDGAQLTVLNWAVLNRRCSIDGAQLTPDAFLLRYTKMVRFYWQQPLD